MGTRPLSLESPVTALPGVGPKRAERLARLGIGTVEDVLRHAPRAYEDRGEVVPVERAAELPAGAFAVVRGTVQKRSLRRMGRRRSTLSVRIADPTGVVEAIWFNAPFLASELPVGANVALAGRLSKDGALLQPELARVAEDGDVPDRLTGIRPLYPLTDGVTRRLVHELVEHALSVGEGVPDPLPAEVRARCGVEPLGRAVRLAHRPRTMEEAVAGRERLLFDELLPLEMAILRRARNRRRRSAPRGSRSGGGVAALIARLPFELSDSQSAAVDETIADLDAPHPMARLLSGEVGSGKTVVALAAIQEARSRGLQCALLAPTDLLARQHERTVRSLLGDDPRVELLTGSLAPAEARTARERLATGEADLAIGTHALFSESTEFRRLGFVVIDEQQRFGVEQRAALLRKARTPHCLVLTATPIPRTLALLGFGDCDLSTLDPRPGARGDVATRVIPWKRRAAELRRVRALLEKGEQGFFVRPRIEGSDAGAVELAEELAADGLAGLDVALVHGRLSPAEREERLEAFRAGSVAALVSTTVIEVGLDVAGASVLWVEGAERLGLSTLHQLRGRVARRGQRGYCWVVEGADAPEGSSTRLRALAETDDGMRLAEIDLMLRGPGELLGLRQSGRLGILAGLGPNAPAKLAELAERAAVAAEILLDAEESRCSEPVAASSSSAPPSSASPRRA